MLFRGDRHGSSPLEILYFRLSAQLLQFLIFVFCFRGDDRNTQEDDEYDTILAFMDGFSYWIIFASIVICVTWLLSNHECIHKRIRERQKKKLKDVIFGF